MQFLEVSDDRSLADHWQASENRHRTSRNIARATVNTDTRLPRLPELICDLLRRFAGLFGPHRWRL